MEAGEMSQGAGEDEDHDDYNTPTRTRVILVVCATKQEKNEKEEQWESREELEKAGNQEWELLSGERAQKLWAKWGRCRQDYRTKQRRR